MPLTHATMLITASTSQQIQTQRATKAGQARSPSRAPDVTLYQVQFLTSGSTGGGRGAVVKSRVASEAYAKNAKEKHARRSSHIFWGRRGGRGRRGLVEGGSVCTQAFVTEHIQDGHGLEASESHDI